MRMPLYYLALSLLIVATSSFSQASQPAGPGSPGATGPAPEQIDKGNGPFTDPCGTTISVSEGAVSVKYKTIKTGPNAGKKCISKIVAGSNDTVTITIPDGVEVEINISGKADVTINANDQGKKDSTNAKDSEPGIKISGDGGLDSSGSFQGSVGVNGNNNVISINGKNHQIAISGDGNVVFNKGSNSPVITTGTGNIVYS